MRFAALREQNRRVIEDVDGGKIYSTDLVNCLPNGKVQTVNSMKYPTREIKKKLGIVNNRRCIMMVDTSPISTLAIPFW